MMRQSQTPNAATTGVPSDLWLRDDPWSGYVPPVKIAKSKQEPNVIDTIHAAVERKVATGLLALEEKFKPTDEVMGSVDDARVAVLESRMTQLEAAVSQQQNHKFMKRTLPSSLHKCKHRSSPKLLDCRGTWTNDFRSSWDISNVCCIKSPGIMASD